MRKVSRAVGMLLIFGVATVAPMMAAGTYVLGGLTGSITGDSDYGWDGGSNTAFRAALQNSSNFGASGIITTGINTVNISNTGNLAGIQGLVVPWWANSSANVTQVNQVVAFFHSGGDLLLAQDDAGNAPVGNALGITTNDGASGTWSPQNYFTNGPFGAISASSLTAYFDIASFPSTYGGTAGTVDSGSNVTTIYWPKHSFCPTCGALIINGDVDTWATGATFSPLNADGVYSLDLMAYIIQNTGGFVATGGLPGAPAPASLWLILIGLIATAVYFGYHNRQRPSAN